MTVQAPPTEEASAVAAPAAAGQPWPRPATAWYTLAVLSAVLGLSQIDRGVISLLAGPIKKDLGLSDVQFGLLTGLAFSSIYLVLSLPLSRLSDSRSRKVMITCGLTVWSLATAACGLAQTFWQMFVARAVLGAGESVNGPATYSLLADNFPREKLPRAMALLNFGFIAGTAFSLIVGGMIIAAVSAHPDVRLPVVGAVRNWQIVFFAVGLPGLLVAAMMLTVPEPLRRGLRAQARGPAVPVAEVLRFLHRNRRLYGAIFASMFLAGIEIYGAQTFRPAFFQRTYDWPLAKIGVVLGFTQFFTMPVALFLGAWLTELLNRRHDDGNVRVWLLAHCVAAPFAIASPLMPTPELSVACVAIAGMAPLVGGPPLVAAMQSVTPNEMRAQISSLYLIMFSGVTAILGPLLLGAVTDYVLRDESKLNLALSGSAAITLPLGIVIMAFAVKPFGHAIRAIKEKEALGQV